MSARAEVLFYVPGSAPFPRSVHERRTATYRTWHGQGDAGYGAECLLCGEWRSGLARRGHAELWATAVHMTWCHVTHGCHCPDPHLTAALAARIGVKDSYPRSLARELFAMAGGTRRYLQPRTDRIGNEFGPLVCELGDVKVCLGHAKVSVAQ
jgi:hypothetical protein